jgi:DNA adenine methylase
MISLAGTLAAPFPYFGVKALAARAVWQEFGAVDNYVEPFCGSAAMLLSRPGAAPWGVETLNDADGFLVNFWRAVAADPEAVAHHADWPVSEADLEARHGWLVNRAERLRWQLEDPDFYDPKVAGWWVWGACAWIGGGWCAGLGPHQSNGAAIVDTRQLPHLSAGQGINRKLPHLSGGRGINRQLPHLGDTGRGAYIREWFGRLAVRLRDVRFACGDWSRVVSDSVTVCHGTTAVFLDPPYTKGNMDYAAGGVGGELAGQVRAWCRDNGARSGLRIVLCGHAGEHDDLLAHGWRLRKWEARKGYAVTDDAVKNSASETVWCSPHCMGAGAQVGLFEEADA